MPTHTRIGVGFLVKLFADTVQKRCADDPSSKACLALQEEAQQRPNISETAEKIVADVQKWCADDPSSKD